MKRLFITMKRNLFLPLFAAVLGWLCGTIAAPLVLDFIVWLLQPDYRVPYRCTYGGGQDAPAPLKGE